MCKSMDNHDSQCKFSMHFIKELLCSAILSKNDQSICIESIESKILTNSTGNISDLIGLEVKWSSKSDQSNLMNSEKDDIIDVSKLPTRFILKSPQIDGLRQRVEHAIGSTVDQTDKQCAEDFVSAMHKNECIAYEILSVEKPVPMPKVYAYQYNSCQQPRFLLMEDLRTAAGTLTDLSPGLTLGQWRNAVEALADLHAWSLVTQAPWREKVADVEQTCQFFKTFFKMSFGTVAQSKARFPEYLGHVDESLIAKELEFDSYIKKVTMFKCHMPQVLQHGDAWTNNIMFTKNPDGSLSDQVAALIDWQLCMSGCGLYDLTRLEVWCVRPTVRRLHSRSMLKRYYERLTSKSRDQFAVDFETVKMVYDTAFVLESLVTVIMVDTMLNFMGDNQQQQQQQQQQQPADQNHGREKQCEILERIKAAYDDAVHLLCRRQKQIGI